jgi:hypothetical protein
MGASLSELIDPKTLAPEILNEIWRLRAVRRQTRFDMVVRAAFAYDAARARADHPAEAGCLAQREDALLAAVRYASEILAPPVGITTAEVEAANSMLQTRIDLARREQERAVAEGYASGKVISLTERRAQRYG